MPLYDFNCPTCNTITEAVVSYECTELDCTCGGVMHRQFPLQAALNNEVFEAQWMEHLDTEPVYVSSRRQFKQECDKRGLTSVYLANSGIPLK